VAVLIDLKHPSWTTDEVLLNDVRPLAPAVDWRVSQTAGDLNDIDMLIVSGYNPGEALNYPNLRLIQKTGAGVENILADTSIPAGVQIARSDAAGCAAEMGEYALAYVLQEQRQLRRYQANQDRAEWMPAPPRQAHQTTVAVLGLGRMGRAVAERFAVNGFSVAGWSRTSKSIPGVQTYIGQEGLASTVGAADYVVSVLPSTDATKGLLDARFFAMCKPGAIVITIGRGDQTNEPDLLAALDNGRLGGAVVDVCATEPLPRHDPLWSHPLVQITPHVAGWHSYVAADLVENHRRCLSDEPILHLVDRTRGY